MRHYLGETLFCNTAAMWKECPLENRLQGFDSIVCYMYYIAYALCSVRDRTSYVQVEHCISGTLGMQFA